ncbi:hypothetical protein FA15DRAFT_103509 [Coprinopsis marcescibilis]|uniref:Uncharacterized protein n=1 Tax=Coprinopsis marcescibilis TaxID=230819 RepID=A0A5C3KLU2_COPMA|nr:hypothetical protein FA15DRAFT_103509 [Coprinopsis marcescibilis]
MANNAPPPQYNRHAPQNQPPRNIAPPPVSVKTEPRQATTVPHPLANTVNDMKGKAPMRAYQTNFTAPVPAPAARPPADRHVSFAAQDTAATSSTIGTSPDNAADNNSDSFGFSDDDAFFASVVVDDLGPPIGVEADMGRPIEVDADSGRPLHEENDRSGVNDMLMAPPLNPQPQQPQQPANRSESKKGSGSRLAIIAAQLEQQRQDEAAAAGASEAASRGSNSHATLPSVTDLQPTLNKQRSSTSLSGKTHNENRNPNWQQPTGGDEKPIVKSSGPPPPMGGFNFPSGTSNPLQGLGAGMKRPMEMMAGEGSANHAAAFSRTTARSGMGLHQASNMATAQGGRQVLGRLDNGPDGGDAKRMRRFV